MSVAGDVIEIETLQAREVYLIERMWVVEPEDVYVLEPTPVRSITLVTCYPFYFAGSAPHRYIVRAVLADDASCPPRRRGRDRVDRWAGAAAGDCTMWSGRPTRHSARGGLKRRF